MKGRELERLRFTKTDIIHMHVCGSMAYGISQFHASRICVVSMIHVNMYSYMLHA